MLENIWGEGEARLRANDDIMREELLRASGVVLSTVRLEQVLSLRISLIGAEKNWAIPEFIVHGSVIWNCNSLKEKTMFLLFTLCHQANSKWR